MPDINVKEHALTFLLALATGIGGSWFALKQAQVSATPQGYQALFARIESLEGEVRRLSALYFEARTENALLKMQLDAQFSSTPRGTIVNYLDSLQERPAWCKEYVPSEDAFVMLHINSAYEVFYDVTNERYRGKRDTDVHGQVLGRQYESNDRIALARKGFRSFWEVVKVGKEQRRLEFWKFFVPLPDETELICGIQVTP